MSNQYKIIRTERFSIILFSYSMKNGQKRAFLFENIKNIELYA
jgi:hypothetical protein